MSRYNYVLVVIAIRTRDVIMSKFIQSNLRLAILLVSGISVVNVRLSLM